MHAVIMRGIAGNALFASHEIAASRRRARTKKHAVRTVGSFMTRIESAAAARDGGVFAPQTRHVE